LGMIHPFHVSWLMIWGFFKVSEAISRYLDEGWVFQRW